MFKLIRRILDKLSSYKKDLVHYSIDNPKSNVYQKLETFFLSRKFALFVDGFIGSIFVTYRIIKLAYDRVSEKFVFRSIVFWFVFNIILILSIVYGIIAVENIANNKDTFISNNDRLTSESVEFKFDPNSLTTKYSEATYSSYNDYAQQVETQIKAQIDEIFKGYSVINSFNDTSSGDFKYAIRNNDTISVSGPYDEIQNLINIENKFVPNSDSSNVVSFTDEYGRPLFYGESFNYNYVTPPGTNNNGVFDPTELFPNEKYQINSEGRTGEDSSNNGKNLYQIGGRWWGKLLQGNVFSGNSVAASKNKNFSNVTFTLSKDGFFTAFTQYLYIMQADYQYVHETLGNHDATYNPYPSGAGWSPTAHFTKDATKGSQPYDINQYLAARLHFTHILIWINQDSIFTCQRNSNETGHYTYNFQWNTDNAKGTAFKDEATNYVTTIHNNNPGDLSDLSTLDYQQRYWFYLPEDPQNPTQIANGFQSDSETAPNFLDFGFDHGKPFRLDPSNKTEIPKPDGWIGLGTQEWGEPTLQPYTYENSQEDGDKTNPNYNVLHLFHNTTDNLYFTLGFNQNNNVDNKIGFSNQGVHDKNVRSDETDSPYYYGRGFGSGTDAEIIYNGSPYAKILDGITADPRSNSDILNNYVTPAQNSSGLLSVISISSDSSASSGVTSIKYENDPSSKKGISPADVFYNSSNWGLLIPTTTEPNAAQSSDFQKNANIASFYGLIIGNYLNSNYWFSGAATFIPNTYSYQVLDYILLVVSVVLLIILFVYLLFRYRLLGFIISGLMIMFLLFMAIIVDKASYPINSENISIIVFGIFIFLIAISTCISELKKYYLAFNDKAKDKRIFSKGQFLNFINIFAMIFLSAILITFASSTDLLTNSGELIALAIILPFLLVFFVLRYFLLTFLMHKNYEKYDKYFLNFNDKKHLSFDEEDILKNGLITDVKNRQEFIKRIYTELNKHNLKKSNTKNSIKPPNNNGKQK